jgi:two-component system, OmpR family, sensor histidine kinase MprB
MSLRVRFAAVAGAAVAVVAIALSAGAYVSAKAELRGQIDDALVDRAQTYLDGGGGHDRGHNDDEFGQPPPVAFGGAAGSFQVVSPDGTVIRPQGETAKLPVDDRARQLAQRGTGRAFTDATVDGVHLRVLTVGIGTDGAMQVARPLTEVESSLDRLLLVLSLLAAAGVAVAALLGALVARAALAPIRRFTRSTEAMIDDPDLSHRLEEGGRDELGRLARSFNGALSALERSVEAQRHLVEDASHELRTPISSLRANIQTLEHAERLPLEDQEQLRDDIVAELDELTELIADIVELARGVQPGEAVDEVRLDLIVDAICDRAERRAGDTVSFHRALPETIVCGDPERVARAVSNVIDNARKWSPPGGVIDVSLRDGELVVRDHGPGFNEDDLPHIFDRFYRSGKARGTPGSGLGLAIVRQATEAGGGGVVAANAPDGGAVVRLRFAPNGAEARRSG